MDQSHVTERILSLTLEIIYLLTGEGCTVVNMPSQQRTPSSLHLLSGQSSRINSKKILEITNKIIELLTGEVPLRCQDVTVYFSLEEWEYVKGHKDLYKDVMMENLKSSTSEDESEVTFFPENLKICEHPISVLHKLKMNNCADTVAEASILGQHGVPTKVKNIKSTQWKPDNNREGSVSFHEKNDVICSITEDPEISFITEIPKPNCSGDDDCLITENPENQIESDVVRSCSNVQTVQESTDVHDHQSVWEPNCVPAYKKRHAVRNHAEIEYTSDCVIEVSSVSPEITQMNGYPNEASDCSPESYRSIQTAEETKNLMFANVFTPADLTQDELTGIKQELVTWEEESLSFQEIYLPVKHIQHSAVDGTLAINNLHGNFASAQIKMESEEGNVEVYMQQEEAKKAFVDVCTEDGREEYGMDFNTPPMYNCPDCKRSFSSSSNLAKHQLLCRGRKPHVCSGCGKCFASASYLVIHERIHTGERPFSCSHCGKSFSRKPDLVRHERIHTGERPFACPDCGKRFTSVSNIFMHRRIHTGVKPFACSHCGKRFIKKSDLVRHEKIHLPQRPLPCPECGHFFASNHILNKHMLSHAGSMQVAFQGGS